MKVSLHHDHHIVSATALIHRTARPSISAMSSLLGISPKRYNKYTTITLSTLPWMVSYCCRPTCRPILRINCERTSCLVNWFHVSTNMIDMKIRMVDHFGTGSIEVYSFLYWSNNIIFIIYGLLVVALVLLNKTHFWQNKLLFGSDDYRCI